MSVLIALAGATATLQGQGNPLQLGNAPVVQAPLAAPDWVKPGYRLTYKVHVRNPEDEKTGGAGISMVLVDVIENEPASNKCVVAARTVLIFTLYGQQFDPALITTSAVDGMSNDYWCTPAAFERVKADAKTKGVTVIEGPVQIDNTTYQCLVFIHKAADHENSVYIDKQSGAVVQVMVSRKVKGKMEGVYLSQLVARRARPMFENALAAPNWVGTTQRLRFTGTRTTVMDGAPPIQNQLTVTFNLQKMIGQAAEYKVDVTDNGMAGNNSSSVVLHQAPTAIGGAWLSPTLLQSMREGQVIDQDPTLNSTVKVSRIWQMPDGRSVVTIAEEMAGFTSTSDYDRNAGTLLQTRQHRKAIFMVTELVYQGT
jgi:hypothetical protein